MRKVLSLVTGIFFTLLGILLLLRNFDIIPVIVPESFATIWPLWIVAMGIALVLGKKRIAWAILALLLLLGSLYIVQSIDIKPGPLRTVTQYVEYDSSEHSLDLTLQYGAGTLTVDVSDSNWLVYNDITTTDIKSPKIKEISHNGTRHIIISREPQPSSLFGNDEHWDLGIHPDITTDLDISYGATRAHFDLRKLSISSLILQGGATDSTIIFGEYPINVSIDAGASNYNLEFPANVQALLDIDGGVVTSELDGFIKRNDYYISNTTIENAPLVLVHINAGATTINARVIDYD